MMKKIGLGKFFIIALSIFMYTGSISVYAKDMPETKTVTIYHTNDMHGALKGNDSCIGLEKVAALKDQTENSILVDAGDATQGLPLASLSQGADIIDIMNIAGYDVMAAGNHEFDYGTKQFLANATRATFPILAANVYNKKTNAPLLSGTMNDSSNIGCHTIIEVDGVKVGFFGITTLETKTATNPSGIQDVEFKEEIETTKKEIDELEDAGADVIVAITHLGEYTNVPCNSEELAESMVDNYQGKLDVIVDGHSHTVKNNGKVNDVLIQQTGTGLVNLGKIELTLSNSNELTDAEGSILLYDDINVEPKQSVANKITEITNIQNETMLQQICELKNTLWGGYVNDIAVARMAETNLGDFAADAYLHAASQFIDNANAMEQYQDIPIIAVENGGGIRNSLAKGNVTMGDVVTVFPFSNTVVIKEITPNILYEALEVSISDITGQDKNTGQLLGIPNGGFLQIGGFTFAYNPLAPVGTKVENVYINQTDKSLDRNDTQTRLLLASNNFIMDGGNGYSMLGPAPLVGEIGGELETVLEYINVNSTNGTQPLNPKNLINRIQYRGEYTKTQYEAIIKVLDSTSGKIATNRKVPVYIDNDDNAVYVRTDDQGMAKITLANGEHSISTSKDATVPVYVNNYMGVGVSNEDPLVFTGEFAIYEDAKPPVEDSKEVEIVPTNDSIPVELYAIALLASVVVIKKQYIKSRY